MLSNIGNKNMNYTGAINRRPNIALMGAHEWAKHCAENTVPYDRDEFRESRSDYRRLGRSALVPEVRSIVPVAQL